MRAARLTSRPPAASRRRAVVARGGPLGITKLPCWVSPHTVLPPATGKLHLHEPRFVSMFDELQRGQLVSGVSQPMRFGHICSPSAAARDGAAQLDVSGWPAVGGLARVTRFARNDNGTLDVEYELCGRFKLINVLQEAPVMTALVTDYVDESDTLAPIQRTQLDELEQEVFHALTELEQLGAKLEEGSEDRSMGRLPSAIRRYAPPPVDATASLGQAMASAGHAGGYEVDAYMRQPSVYGKLHRAKTRSHDPYTLVSEKLGKHTRQELFSFSAASLIDGMGNVERLMLLTSRDTAARLGFVLQALDPYLQELRAKLSVKRLDVQAGR